jgi:hypothetical protein
MSITVALMRDRSRTLCQTGRHSGGRNFGGVRTQAGSELSRQVPVDLKPDADLNEGRGAPGHWSSSLAFPSGNTLDRGTPPRKPPQPHRRKHRRAYSAREFYCRPPSGSR